MKVLLVWQEVPEDVKWFVIDNATESDLAMLGAAHGYFLGCDRPEEAMEPLDRINALLANPKYGSDGFDPDHVPLIGQWRALQIPQERVMTIGPIDKVFTCGFLL